MFIAKMVENKVILAPVLTTAAISVIKTIYKIFTTTSNK